VSDPHESSGAAVLHGHQGEHAVLLLAKTSEGHGCQLVADLIAVEANVTGPELDPVVVILAFQCPDADAPRLSDTSVGDVRCGAS
jgi:hypothetical protein